MRCDTGEDLFAQVTTHSIALNQLNPLELFRKVFVGVIISAAYKANSDKTEKLEFSFSFGNMIEPNIVINRAL